MLYPFSALLARMKYITRWSLMHSTRAESLSEHTCDTALLAHLLCLIAKHYTGTPCRPEVVAVAALSKFVSGYETEAVAALTGLSADRITVAKWQ